MGPLVLLLLVLAEIVMLVVCIKGRGSTQKWIRTRTIVSVCEVLVLAVLMVLPFSNVAFDFRWMALFIVLALRAIIAVIVFLARRRKASPDAPHPVSRMVFNVLGSIVVILLAAVPSLVFPAYSGLPTTGDLGVREAHAIMIDSSRTDPFEQDGSYREVPVWFYYPDAPDAEAHQFPLVVSSHGAFGYHESNYSLYTELASHGYVVAALDYPHHSFYTTDTQGSAIIVDRDFITKAMAAQNGELSEDESYAIFHEGALLRMADLGFSLDTIEAASLEAASLDAASLETASQNWSPDDGTWYFESAEQEELVQEAIRLADTEKVGLVGHSLGGATSVGLGRIRGEVGAVIDLDGTMLTEYERNEDGTYVFNEEPYPVPLLSIDNEDHYLEGVQAREQGYPYVNNIVLDNAPVYAHTFFKGSGHMNFTDLPLFSPLLASMLGTGDVDAKTCIEQTNALVLAWFDEYLKGEGHADIAESY